MSDERRNDNSGIVVIVVVLLLIGLLGVIGVGVGGFVMFRVARQQALEAERRAMAELRLAEVQAAMAHADADQARAIAQAVAKEPIDAGSAPADEILLEIDAAGAYTLAGKSIQQDELKAALEKALADHPAGAKLKIQAQVATPFARVQQAMTAGTAAGITHQIIEQK